MCEVARSYKYSLYKDRSRQHISFRRYYVPAHSLQKYALYETSFSRSCMYCTKALFGSPVFRQPSVREATKLLDHFKSISFATSRTGGFSIVW